MFILSKHFIIKSVLVATVHVNTWCPLYSTHINNISCFTEQNLECQDSCHQRPKVCWELYL